MDKVECRKCGSSDYIAISTIHTKKNGEKSTYYKCTRCERDRAKSYWDTEAGRRAKLLANDKYRKANKEKVNKWQSDRLKRNKTVEQTNPTR